MKKIMEYITPMAITFILFIIIYICLGVTPFGNNTVFHYDMALQSYPALTLMYDVLHGDRGLFYNFNIGGGENAYASLVSNGFYSPINWIIAIGEREDIPTITSWILILKFSLVSLSTYYVLKQFFPKLEKKWILLGALLNSVSSYSLLYYVNFQWIECWALFPLIMLGMKNILDGKGGKLFTITLTLCLMISFYMAWLTLLIIIFGGGLALFLYVSKKNRKKAACKIFFNTLISLFISFMSFYPAFSYSMNSYRMENTNEFLKETNPIFFKGLHFLTSPILIFYTLKMLLNYKNDKRGVKLFGGLLLITIIPFIIEPINKMWHTGSYSGLPFRYGFITIFTMVCSMMHYLSVKPKRADENLDNVKKKIVLGIFVIFIIGNIILNINIVKEADEYVFIQGVFDETAVKYYTKIIISVIIGVTILFSLEDVKNSNIQYKFTFIILVINTLFLMGLYIENNELYYLDDVYAKNSVFIAEDMYKDFYEGDEIYKVKDESECLIYNYPYILKMNSIENWFHIIPERQVNTLKKLGYNYHSVVQNDTGGTIITDTILGVKDIFSQKEKNEKLFKLVDSNEEMKKYTYNFKILPFCKIYEKSDIVDNFLTENFIIEDIFKTQNDIYKIFFNQENDIIEIAEKKIINIEKENDKYVVDENSKIEYELDIKNTSSLYLYTYDIENYVNKICVYTDDNEKRLLYENEYKYPANYNNGILDLGVFEEGKIKIEITFVLDSLEQDEIVNGSFKNIELGALDLNQFVKVINEYSENSQNVKFGKNDFQVLVQSTTDENSLFIPINYDEGWSAKINGKEVKISPALGTYMSIDLEEGVNKIEFSFFPTNLKQGILVSTIALLGYILIIISCKFSKIEDTKFANVIYYLGTILFVLSFIAFLFSIYIKPFIGMFLK